MKHKFEALANELNPIAQRYGLTAVHRKVRCTCGTLVDGVSIYKPGKGEEYCDLENIGGLLLELRSFLENLTLQVHMRYFEPSDKVVMRLIEPHE